MPISPNPTLCLHNRHRARFVGASPIEYVLGCVLNPRAFFILAPSPNSLHSTKLYSRHARSIAPSPASHRSFCSTSAIMTYAVFISGSAMATVLASSAKDKAATCRSLALRRDLHTINQNAPKPPSPYSSSSSRLSSHACENQKSSSSENPSNTIFQSHVSE